MTVSQYKGKLQALSRFGRALPITALLAILLPSTGIARTDPPRAPTAPTRQGATALDEVPPVALGGLPGYTHPEVPPQACHLVNAGRRDCVIPGRSAGRYRIEASGASMPIGAHPRQQLTIIVNGRNCTQKLDLTAWTGKTRKITAACEVAILSDAPVLVSVVYADLQALKEARGPDVRFERIPWTGVLEMRDASAP